MNTDLYKLVYCSRNLIRGNHAEVAAELQNILASARRKNARAGVTGALLYNDGNFAQVLEGPLSSVEKIFEVIQCDARHSEVTVVYSGPSVKREFPDWSMAFSGNNADEVNSVATEAFKAAFATSEDAGEQMLSVLKNLVTSEDDCVILDAA